MAETLILNAEGLDDVCGITHPLAPEHLRCTRPPGHAGCHWAPLFVSAERFLVWHPGGITPVRQTYPRQVLLRMLAALPKPGAQTWPW